MVHRYRYLKKIVDTLVTIDQRHFLEAKVYDILCHHDSTVVASSLMFGLLRSSYDLTIVTYPPRASLELEIFDVKL